MNRWRAAGLLRRVETLAAVVVLLVVGILGVAISAATDARHAIDQRGNRLGPANTEAVSLLADFTDEETGVRGLIVTQDPSYLAPYRLAQGRLPAQFQKLTDLLRDEPDLIVKLNQVRIDHDAWVRNIAETEIAAADRKDYNAAADIERSGRGRVRFDNVRASLADLQNGIAAARDESSRRISRAQDVLLTTLVTAVILVLVLTVAVTAAVSRALIRPFNRVRRAVDAVADGDLQTAVPSTGPSEVAELGASVERMRARLVASLDDSRRAVEALTQQGPAVIALRDALAPTRSTAPGVVVEGRLDPAEGVLAGDWYDAIDLPGGRVGVVVGDVAGHGPGPGVFALRLKHLLSAALATGREPGVAVEWVVAQLGDTGEMFATAVVLVLDPVNGQLSYSNAGHPDALLIRGRAGLARNGDDPVRLLPPTGPILSAVVAEPGGWVTRHGVLDPGDLFLAYTDGLVEARGADGQEIGLPGLLAALPELRGSTGELTPHALLEAVFSAVSRHTRGPAADDRTALAIGRTNVISGTPRLPAETPEQSVRGSGKRPTSAP